MAEYFDDSGPTTVRQTGALCLGHTESVVSTIDRRDCDVGPSCPRDDLQRRLDDARARLRLDPPTLGAPLRWSI